MPEGLLHAIDNEARAHYITRSELMRRALIFYLHPEAGIDRPVRPTDLYTNPEELMKILNHQKLGASLRVMLRNMKQQSERNFKR